MANRQQKRQPRTTTNIVVRNGTAANQAGPSRAQQARRRRNRKKPQVNIRVLANQNKAVRRMPRRQRLNNRVVFQTINTTLGTVGSNGSENIECELACLMNPATMKEATGSNSFGPLGIYASTYSLFRMTKCTVILKPLVGSSAVSGTVTRISWNPTSSPTQTSWSALGARKHVDVTPGNVGRFTLTAKDLVGPKGGWYKTNTKGDPMMSFAGTLEIHTIGKTMSTYQNNAFTGGLFLAELQSDWQFKDYSQQPGMLNLIKGEDTQPAHIKTDEGGKLQLVVPQAGRMARAVTTTPSEVIWLVTDTIIQAGTAVIPPPFSWLIRGGWWLVKRAAGAPVRDGELTFDIYASISDARAGMPCITNTPNAQQIPVGGLHFQQITPGNTGIGTDTIVSRTITEAVQAAPSGCYVTSATMLKITTTEVIPAACVWFNNNGGQNHEKGVGFLSGTTQVGTYNIYKVTAHTDIGPIDIGMFPHRVRFYLFADQRWELGYAVASSYDRINDSPNLWVSSILLYVDQGRDHDFTGRWDVTKVVYPTADYRAQITTQKASGNSTLKVRLQRGNWCVVQYVIYGTSDGEYTVGENIIAVHGHGAVSETAHTFTPSASHSDIGLFPAYMSGLKLKPFTTSTVTYSNSLRTGVVVNRSPALDTDPSFGCDDALEFPPPPSEDDLAGDEEEFEDPEEPEASNFFDSDLDDDKDLEMGPDDHYSDPPISRLVVRDDAYALYEQLRATHSERAARLAVNQLYPSDEYTEFIEVYHDALADGLSPKEARAQALGF